MDITLFLRFMSKGRLVSFLAAAVMVAGTAAAQPANVVLTPEGESEYDPSIVINRKNPQNIIVAASRHVYRSSDGGATWETCTLSPDVSNHGDNVVVSDRKGDLYLFHLSGESDTRSDRIACQVSKDYGVTWNLAGVMKVDGDVRYPSVAMEPRSGEFLLLWTQYDAFGSDDATKRSAIMSAESKDGKKWSTPLALSPPGDCRDGHGTPRGGSAVISRDGYRISTWSHQERIYADRSFDKGRTWLSNDIEVEKHPGGTHPVVPGLSHGGGLPILLMNQTSSRYAGTLNLFWADQRNGTNDTDIWYARSVNYGDNWTPATRVNDDAKGKHQHTPAAAIDQSNGNMYVLYYDRRNFDDNQTEVFLAVSRDQGAKFTNVRISDRPFQPASPLPSGHQIGVDAHNGLIVSAWTRYDDGAARIVFAATRDSELSEPKNVSASPE